jgi:hypothetical protein
MDTNRATFLAAATGTVALAATGGEARAAGRVTATSSARRG